MSSQPWRDFPGAHCGLCSIPELESFASSRAKPGLGQGFCIQFLCEELAMLDTGYWILDYKDESFAFVYPASSPARAGHPVSHRFKQCKIYPINLSV
jgi:hypothetical protein